MCSVVQCMSCWIRYETRQFGIWRRPSWASSSDASPRLLYVTVKPKARVSQRGACICQCMCEREWGSGVVTLAITRSAGITHEQISNGTTCIFPSRCPKSHITASGHLWKQLDCSSKTQFSYLLLPSILRLVLLSASLLEYGS